MEEVLKQIFDEKTVKILHEIHGKKIIQVRETSRLTNIPPATVFRIFKKLQAINLLTKEASGTFHVYRVNPDTPAYFILEKLMPKKKPIDAFLESLPKEKIDNISVLDESEDRASLLVIGGIKQSIVQEIAQKIKADYNFSIKLLILSKMQYENLAALNMKPTPKRVLFSNEAEESE